LKCTTAARCCDVRAGRFDRSRVFSISLSASSRSFEEKLIIAWDEVNREVADQWFTDALGDPRHAPGRLDGLEHDDPFASEHHCLPRDQEGTLPPFESSGRDSTSHEFLDAVGLAVGDDHTTLLINA